jgi:cation:H+ antiporter
MDFLTTLLFMAGLVLLIVGAEVLVRGASGLALAVGISPLVVGLTVVAFGTSSPELAVTIQSAWAGNPDIALGNVVGSNIFNVLFILGVSALITPLVVAPQLIRFDVPLMVAVSFLLLFLGLNGEISRLDGAFLFAGIIAYTIWSIYKSRKESKQTAKPAEPAKKQTLLQLVMQVGMIILGLVMLGFGSNWLINGAVALATALGVSQLIIGLTIISAGTSLPEVATSVMASIRGERDIAVGNVVGSNIFNILAVLGLTALVSPLSITVSAAALQFDIPVMIAVAVACLPVFYSRRRISRWEGGLFFFYYLAYTSYLILDTTDHDSLSAFTTAMTYFIVPLTTLALLISVLRTWRANRRESARG